MLTKSGVWVFGVACVVFARPASAQVEEGAEEAAPTATDEETAATAEGEPGEPAAEPQPTPADATTGEDDPLKGLEEIIITGTRIKRKSLATAAPVTVLTRDDLLSAGMMSVGEILQNLPANANAINVQFNNGGDGTTNVDLRGLGAFRTLVLLNGRRHVAGGSGADSSVDLNAIPIAIIERVEVLKDGASAIYGSDAIGGVVNIITKKDFVGVEATGYAGMSQHGDGQVYDISATTGVSSTKGNIVFSASFYDQQEIRARDRDFSKTDKTYFFDPEERKAEGRAFRNNGSPGTPQGTIWWYDDEDGDGIDDLGNPAWQEVANNSCTSGVCYNDPMQGWRDFNEDGNSDTGEGDLYNYQPDNYLLTPQRRLSLWTSGNYELSEWFNTYFEGSFTNRRSVQSLAPEPVYTWPDLMVSADNIYNPYGRPFSDMGRRMVEGGNRMFSQNINTLRLVLGVQGQVPDIGPLHDWDWDFHVNFGRTEGVTTTQGQYVLSRLQRALGPDSECTGDCVPLDLFGGAGSVSPEMLDYITYAGVARGYSDQRIAALDVQGPLFELVEGTPVSLALGYMYRREAGGFQPDPLEAIGDITGTASSPVKGRYHEHAGYAELSLPILGGLPALQLFELTAALRGFNYSTFGSDFTYKFGARWQINNWLAARGTYSTAFRAPSVDELYSGQSDSYPTVSDPCADAAARNDPQVGANCTADVGSSLVNDTSSQLRTKIGGNPNLEPETAHIATGGIVLEDKLVKGLSAAVDYWNISIDNAIQPIGAGIILTSCYQSAPDERKFCELINRGANDKIIDINDTLNNVGTVRTHGMDFDVRYTRPTPIGRFGASLEAVLLFDYLYVMPNGYEWSFKDNYDAGSASSGSNGGVYTSWKANATLAWVLDRYNAGLNFRFIPGFKECDTENLCNAERVEGDPEPFSRDVESNLTMDFFAGVEFDSFLGQTDLTLGVNNLTDQDPAVIYTGFLGTSDASTYDFMGRYFYVRFGQRF